MGEPIRAMASIVGGTAYLSTKGSRDIVDVPKWVRESPDPTHDAMYWLEEELVERFSLGGYVSDSTIEHTASNTTADTYHMTWTEEY